MADKKSAVIVSGHEGLIEDIKADIISMTDAPGLVKDFEPAYSFIMEKMPDFLFLDIRKDAETGFEIAEKVRRDLPETMLFMIAGSKDPDIILRALKAGAEDYIIFPFEQNALLNAVKTAVEKGLRQKREGRLIVVSGYKGGQGGTTLAVNLADHIHTLSGKRVLLVDFNFQTGDVSVFLDLTDSYTPLNFLNDMKRLDENLLFSSLIAHERGFYVISASEDMGEASKIEVEDINNIFQTLKNYMDYIIVDMGHGFTDKTVAVFDIADTILLLVQQAVPSVKSIKKLLDLFHGVGYMEDKVKIIINRYEKNNVLGEKEIEELLGQKTYAVLSNDYLPANNSVNKGELISRNHEDSRINRDIEALAGLITNIKIKKPEAEKNIIKRLLLSIFKKRV